MEEKIYLTIRGIKNFDTEKLEKFRNEIDDILPSIFNSLYRPLKELDRKIYVEIQKRKRRDWVWLEFVATWRGYRSSQDKAVGRYYRKVKKDVAKRIGSFYSHSFTDGTTNDWHIQAVDARGKDSGGYSNQVEECISKYNI